MGKWGIGVMVRDINGVMVAASCWQILLLPDSGVAGALAMKEVFEICKRYVFPKPYRRIRCLNNLPLVAVLLLGITLILMFAFIV